MERTQTGDQDLPDTMVIIAQSPPCVGLDPFFPQGCLRYMRRHEKAIEVSFFFLSFYHFERLDGFSMQIRSALILGKNKVTDF